MKQSPLFSLNWRDILRGLAMAALTPVLTTITNSVDHGEFTLNWHLIYLSAVGGAAAYLLKQLLTKPDKIQAFAEDEEIGGGGIQNPPKP